MGIVEKVDAEIRYDMPRIPRRRHESGDPKPADNLSLKELEDFCFSIRTRGGNDETKVYPNMEKIYDGYDFGKYFVGFKVQASATMDGYPALPPAKVDPPKSGLVVTRSNAITTATILFNIVLWTLIILL